MATYSLNNYRNGNILSLTVTNFQTFKKQRFTFGPALNLIAAPNGSGKSSIANSIAFLFNGTPKTIGKSKVITEFIRFGSDEAEIEGEIFYNNKIYNLKRIITQNGNNYFIDSRLVNKTEYYKLLDEICIDVNNLCTFLPQERVSEFSRMSPSELLQEFLKTTDVDMTILKRNYDDLTQINMRLESMEKKKEIAEHNYNILKDTLDAYNERINNEEKLKKLYFLKYHTEYKKFKDEYQRYKQDILIIQERKIEIEAKEQNIKKEIKIIEEKDEFKSYNSSCRILDDQNQKISEIGNTIKQNNFEIDALKSNIRNRYKKIEEKRADLDAKKNELVECKEKLKKSKIDKDMEIKNYISKINTLYDNPEFSEYLGTKKLDIPLNITRTEQVEQLIPSTRIIEDKIKGLEHNISQMRIDSEKIQKEIEGYEKQKLNFSEIGNQRLEMLKNYHLDTYKGVMWLRNNKIFKEEVLEPCYLHINIDKDYSEYVETFLSFQALSTFIVRNDDDFRKLTTILKDELNLGINVSTMSVSSHQRINNEGLKRFHLDGVVSDFIECRQEYKDYLNAHGWFQCIPISRHEIYSIKNGVKVAASEEDIFREIPNVKRTAINGRYSEMKTSRYGNDFVIFTNNISAKETFYFPKVDVEFINAQLKTLNDQRGQNKPKMDKILEERIDLQNKRNYLRTEFDISKISKMIYFYNTNLNNISHLETLISQFDISTSEKLILEEKDRIAGFEARGCQLFSRLEELLDFDNIPFFDIEKFKGLTLDLENLNKNLIINDFQKEEDLNKLKHMEKLKADNKEKLEDLKAKLRGSSEYKIEDLKGLPEAIYEIEAEINVLRTKLEITSTNNTFLTNFKEKERMVEGLLDNLDAINSKKLQIEKRYEDEKERVSAQIHTFLSPVNDIFRNLFRKLNFEGQIVLDTTGKDWELRILVKFREMEDLQNLTAFRQSGGEKSLTTVMFLLALQQCQPAPFRLVDEVNQGMDSINERKVFEILKEMGETSQFFIITPKLIDDIVFSKNSNAIIVYGGSGITKDLENYALQILN